MVRQKSLEFFYKDIAKIEESVEHLLRLDLHSDRIFKMLDIFSELKYISETISAVIDGDDNIDFQIIDVVEFLYYTYVLHQCEIIKLLFEAIKREIQYHPKINSLLNELNIIIKKIREMKKSEKFNF